MDEEQLTISQLYAKGKDNLKAKGVDWAYPAGRRMGPSVKANRKYLDSLFFEPKFLDPVDVDTNLTIFGVKLKTPVFCSAISRLAHMSETDIADIARGVASAGSLISNLLINLTPFRFLLGNPIPFTPFLLSRGRGKYSL